jgi:small subunit ribosomal protein S21
MREGESIDEALRRFRNVCRSAHIQEDYKRAQRYEKPSERKRRKIKESEKRRARKGRNG